MHVNNYILFFIFCQDFYCFFGIIPKISIDHLCTITKNRLNTIKTPATHLRSGHSIYFSFSKTLISVLDQVIGVIET